MGAVLHRSVLIEGYEHRVAELEDELRTRDRELIRSLAIYFLGLRITRLERDIEGKLSKIEASIHRLEKVLSDRTLCYDFVLRGLQARVNLQRPRYPLSPPQSNLFSGFLETQEKSETEDESKEK